jgi:peptidoglycan-N-acetylglucosamine deacetylase
MTRAKRPNSIVLAWLTIIVVAVLVLVAGWAGDRMGRAQAAEVEYHYPLGNVVYLTFDDGPSPAYTSQVIADLNAVGAHATFFQIGVNMVGNCSYMKWMLREGEQLGTHTWTHPSLPSLDYAQTAEQISKARAYSVACTGYDSRLFRFPYNRETENGNIYLGSQDMLQIGSGIDPSDWEWKKVTDADIISYTMARVYPGAIIQLHDGLDVLGRDGGHPGFLPGLLRDLKARGYAMVTLPSQGVPKTSAES